MKTKLLLKFIFVVFATHVLAQTTPIPDANFEQALIDLGYDTNGLNGNILNSDAESVNILNVSNKNISSITGIEAFKNLQIFTCNNNNISSIILNNHPSLQLINCSNNNLTSLDISSIGNLDDLNCSYNAITSLNTNSNPFLRKLYCHYNQLSSLNVSSNPQLEFLFCHNNRLTSLNLNSNTALKGLSCYVNNLSSLAVANCTVLESLKVQSNNLTTLAVPNSPVLIFLWCYSNNLTTLTVPNTTSLTEVLCYNNNMSSLSITNSPTLMEIQCYNNNLESLDVSGNTALELLGCNNNSIEVLDLSTNSSLRNIACNDNNLKLLDLKNGNNTSINYQSFINNDNLSCIEVDDPAYSTSYWNNVDPQSYYSNYCGFDLTRIPDQNFEQYLINKGIDTNGLDGYILNSDAATATNLDINNLGITTLAGIQAFVNLNTLICNQNAITFLDLSNNPALTEVSCQDNTLTSLNIKNGNNTNIITFKAYGNPNLSCIEVDDSSYSTNNWTAIDASASFSTNCNYEQVYVPDNNFEQALIDLGYDYGLLDDYVLKNAINQVKVLDVGSKNINSLKGITYFSALEELSCDVNNITDIVLSNNTQLKTLNCQYNSLTSLDISNNINLETLNCLENNIGILDLSNNASLTSLDCSINNLSKLNVKNGNNTNMTFFNALFNGNLTCVEVDNESYSTSNWTNIDAQTSFSANCTLSIEETQKDKLKLYPNPVSDVLTLDVPLNGKYFLYALNGQIIKTNSIESGTNKISLNEVKSGIYLLKVITDSSTFYKKIIKK